MQISYKKIDFTLNLIKTLKYVFLKAHHTLKGKLERCQVR